MEIFKIFDIKKAGLSCLKWSKVRQKQKGREWHSQSGFQSVIRRIVTLHWCCGWVWSDWSILGWWTCGFLLLFPSLTMFSFSLSKCFCLACPPFLFESFFCLIFSTSFYKGAQARMMMCVCTNAQVPTWVSGPIRCGGVDFGPRWPKEGLLSWLEANSRERERERAETRWGVPVFDWSTAVWK